MLPLTSKRKIAKIISAFWLIVLSFFMLTGCSSFDKDDSSIDIKNIDFKYYEETNITKVSCQLEIKNGTIYNISDFTIVLRTYSNGAIINEYSYEYDTRIKHGESQACTITFNQNGEIDDVGFIRWEPQFESIFKTYMTWIIIAGVVLISIPIIWIFKEIF